MNIFLQTIEVFLIKEVSDVVTDRESWQINKSTQSTPGEQQSNFNSNENPRPERSVRPVSILLTIKR